MDKTYTRKTLLSRTKEQLVDMIECLQKNNASLQANQERMFAMSLKIDKEVISFIKNYKKIFEV